MPKSDSDKLEARLRLVATPSTDDEDDIYEILDDLDKACFPTDSPYKKTGSRYWWIAYIGKQEIGFAGVGIFDNDAAFMCRAGVLPQFRSRGIHKRLIRTRLRYLKKLGFKQAITYTSITNTRSANALIKCRFKMYRPAFAWAGDDVIYFSKNI
jgi:GNAT superfamily N-acetyltransferase